MSRKRIGISHDVAAILLPEEMLEEMGVREGEEVDFSVLEGPLTMWPLDASRTRVLEDATKAVFERRNTAYRELQNVSQHDNKQ